MAAHDDHDHDERDQAHSRGHDHNHSHDHDKPWQAVRTEAMEALLSELGLVDSNRVDEIVSYYEEGIGPKSGLASLPKPGRTRLLRPGFLQAGLMLVLSWASAAQRPNIFTLSKTRRACTT